MRKVPPIVFAGLLAIVGALLQLSIADPTFRAGSVWARAGLIVVGQFCWLVAGLMLLVRAAAYADDHISYDGPGIILFNTAKWGATTILIFADAFLMERAWEIMFILPR